MNVRQILAGLCAFLLIASGVAALLLFNVERKAFSAETYKRAFDKQGLYEDAAGLLAEAISSSDGSGASYQMLSILNREDLEEAISILIPPQELETMTDNLFDSVFLFLDGKTETVTVSLISLKKNLTGEAGTRAITLILQAQPDCTADQLLQMGFGALSGAQGMALCNPPPAMLGLVMPLIEIQLQSVVNELPNELPVFSAKQGGPAGDFRPQLNRVRAVMKFSPLLPLALLLAVTALAVRTLGEWLKWWGIPLLITGILGTALALAAPPLLPSILGNMLSQGAPEMPALFIELLLKTADSLTHEIFNPIVIQGIAIALTGFLMLIASLVPGRKPSRAA